MLLLTLLPLVGWAASATIVNTDGTAGYVVLPATGGIAPEELAVKIGETVKPGTAIYAADGVTAVDGSITEMGNYFLKVDDTGALYPFQAAEVKKNGSVFDFVWNAESWLTANGQGRGLNMYYSYFEGLETPQYLDYGWWHDADYQDVNPAEAANPLFTKMWDQENPSSAWGSNFNRSWISAINCIDKAWPERTSNAKADVLKYDSQDEDAGVYAEIADFGGPTENWLKYGYPWVVFAFDTEEENDYNVVFRYNGATTTLTDASLGAMKFGKSRKWATVSGLFSETFNQVTSYPLWLDVDNKTGEPKATPFPAFVDYAGEAFDIDKLEVLLLPAEAPNADLLRDYTWTMTPTTVGYNAQAQAPTITVTAKDLSGQTVTVPQFNATDGSENWTARYFTTAETPEEVEEMINKGVYDVYVYLAGEDQPIGGVAGAKQFEITAFQLTLGASTTYKQLGDPDPAPNYGLLYDNAPEAVKAEAANLIIDGLYLHRIAGYDDPENDYAGRDIKFFMEMNNASVKNQDGTTNTNYMISISSTEAWLIITKKLIRDGEFRAVVNDDIFTYDGLAKEPTDIALEQDKNFDKRGEADYEADWQLVSGFGSILGTVSENFEITYANNIAADAYGEPRLQGEEPNQEAVYDWMANVEPANRATVILTPKEDGNFASIIPLGNEQYLEGADNVTGQFKIKQRNINTATIAEIDEVIFKNADFTPTPAVTYDNGTETGLTLVSGEDFDYGYSDNKYVGTATVTVEATNIVTVGGDVTIKTYTGNWWNKQDATFDISAFEFTLKPVDIQKTVGDTDPDPLTTLEAIPSANMVNGEGQPLTFPVTDVTTLLKQGWTLSRAKGEYPAVCDINVNNAELLASDPADVSDPAHNYIMTVETGVLEIVEPHAFYISSVGVEKEFRSGNTTIPFDGFYLYHRNNVGEYLEVTEGEVYEELAEKITANERTAVGGNFPQAGTYNNQIRPVIPTDLGIDVAYLPVGNYTHVGVEGQVNEGTLIITPRKVTIVAEDKTTVFGEDYAELTYKLYDGHVEENFVGLQESEVQLNQGTAYAANTIAYFGGLRTEIATAVAAADKPLTANVTDPIVIVDHYLNDTQTTAQRNPNYDIKFINGTYTVTPSTEGYFVTVEWEKKYGDTQWTKTVTWTFGDSKETAEPITGDKPFTDDEIGFSWTDDQEPTTPDTYESGTDFTITYPEGGNVIGGYQVTYEGTATITKADAIIIAVKTLGSEYPVPPTLSFDNKRVTVTGTTFADVAAYGNFVLTYTKPEVGFIKDGAPVQVEFNGKAYGTAAGEEVDPEDWAWAANYEKVTVKSGKVMVTAPDEITLDVVAFNKASYDEEYDVNDQLIRDYHGTPVKKIHFASSAQNDYVVKHDQWYSMVLPFDATVRQIQKIFNGFVAVDILDINHSAAKASQIKFSLTVGDVEANTPFIAKTDLDYTFPAENSTIEDANGIEIKYPVDGAIAEDANGNQFIGTYEAFFADDATSYDLINLSKGAISPAAVDAYVRPLGAYIKVAAGVPNNEVRIFIEEADGTITAINGVNGKVESVNGEGIYNLSGQRVNKAQKGIYIQDGKKVLVK